MKMLPAVVFAALLSLASVADAQSPPVEAFASRLFETVSLSPSGRYVAAKARLDNRYALLIYDLEKGGQPTMVGPGHMHLDWVHWKSDKRLLASLWFPSRRWGVGTVETRLFSVAPDGSKPKLLVAPREWDPVPVQLGDAIMNLLPDDPDHVLMAFNAEDPSLPRLYKVNVHSDRRQLIEKGKAGVLRWIVDQQGRPRIAYGIHVNRKLEVMYFKDADGGDWETWYERPLDSGPVFSPVLFDRQDPNLLYVFSDHEANTRGLYTFDFRTRQFRDRLFLHPDVDANHLVYGPQRTEIHGVGYVEDRTRVEWFDERQRDYVEDVRLRVGADYARIVSSSRDYRVVAVYAESPHKPGRFYLYEPATKKLSYFANTFPGLEDQPLSRMRPTSFTARDGLEIPAYLSLPPGTATKPERPLPAVIFPHGGPQARDVAAFDPLVQLMTSRGYAVLQLNFRGSAGYGREFREAGHREWGQAMQDDVTDGTRWLIAEGYADADRICIVGWSYGGYAALMGAVKEPGLYRCASSIAGVTDLPALLRHRRPYMLRDIPTRFVGDLWKDREALEENSPVNRAADIRVPVLLAHGTRDRVVPPRQSVVMAKALASAGRDHEYLELEGADHSVRDGAERLRLFRALDEFLAAHLAPAPAVAVDAPEQP